MWKRLGIAMMLVLTLLSTSSGLTRVAALEAPQPSDDDPLRLLLAQVQSKTAERLKVQGPGDDSYVTATWSQPSTAWTIPIGYVPTIWPDVLWRSTPDELILINRKGDDPILGDLERYYPVSVLRCERRIPTACQLETSRSINEVQFYAHLTPDSEVVSWPIPLTALIRAFGARDWKITPEPANSQSTLKIWTQYPVVLVHGILSTVEGAFDSPVDWSLDTLRSLLSRHMIPTYGHDLGRNPAKDPVQQAELVFQDVQNALQAAPKVTIIGHSKGGLVARLLLAMHPELARKIDKIITLDTPHRLLPARSNLLGFGPLQILQMAKAEWPKQFYDSLYQELLLPTDDVATIQRYFSMEIPPIKDDYPGHAITWILYEAESHRPVSLGLEKDFGSQSFAAGNGCSRSRFVNGANHSSVHDSPVAEAVLLDLFSTDRVCRPLSRSMSPQRLTVVTSKMLEPDASVDRGHVEVALKRDTPASKLPTGPNPVSMKLSDMELHTSTGGDGWWRRNNERSNFGIWGPNGSDSAVMQGKTYPQVMQIATCGTVRASWSWDLRGEYAKITGVLGLDDYFNKLTTQILINGDQKEMASLSLIPQSAPLPLSLELTDIKVLEIVITVTGSSGCPGGYAAGKTTWSVVDIDASLYPVNRSERAGGP